MNGHSWRYRATLLVLLFFPSFSSLAQPPQAVNGQLDARTWDFTNSQLALNGTWTWLDFELLSPRDMADTIGQSVDFPKVWNEIRPFRGGEGFATYALTILLPEGEQEYSFEVPQIYSSYRLYANQKLIGSNGELGRNKESNKPQWRSQVVSCKASGRIDLVLQIVNFHHHKGGIKEQIYFGLSSVIREKDKLSVVSNWIECGVLILISVIAFVIFFLYGRKKVTLFFALLCFTWAVRSVFSNRYVMIDQFPDFNWTWMVKIEYLTLFFTMIFAILYIARLFMDEVNQIIKYGLLMINFSFVAVTLFSEPIIFTRWINAYLVISGIILLYSAYIIIQALINDRIASGSLSISILLGIVIFSYDIFTYEGLFAYNDLLFSGGYIILFLLMGYGLLMHLQIIKSGARPITKLSYTDLYNKDHSSK